MQDEMQMLEDWLSRGYDVAVATVVKTYGSAPRREGSKMLVNSRGEMQGSVSGGCVEGAVFEECARTLKTGRPKLLKFGVADEAAWEVGLACGGTIEVFVEKINW